MNYANYEGPLSHACISKVAIVSSNLDDVSLIIMYLYKEERSGGTVDWPFMLYTLNVMYQVRLGKISEHKMKIAFMGI